MSIYTFAVKNARVFVSGSNYNWADSVTKVWPDIRVGFELLTFFEPEKSIPDIMTDLVFAGGQIWLLCMIYPKTRLTGAYAK